MPKFGEESLKNLKTLHPELQRLLVEAIKRVDFKITCGFRGQFEQHKAFIEGVSEKDWPNSKHNTYPSEAADVVLYYPEGQHIRWNEKENQYMFIGALRGMAWMMGINLRVGADWNGNFDIRDQKFHDIVHIEVILPTPVA